MVQVKLSTLTDRAKGRHDWKSSFAKRQLLTPAQEKTLVQWAKHRAEIGLPYSVQDLRIRAAEISGKKVGRKWTLRFEKPQLHAAKPVNLDPKRAKNFNEAIINEINELILVFIFLSLGRQIRSTVNVGWTRSLYHSQSSTVSITQSQLSSRWMVTTHMRHQSSSVQASGRRRLGDHYFLLSGVGRKWQEVCDNYLQENTPIDRFTIIPAYVRGTREVFTKELAEKAFKKRVFIQSTVQFSSHKILLRAKSHPPLHMYPILSPLMFLPPIRLSFQMTRTICPLVKTKIWIRRCQELIPKT
jgi:hypothetical protein